MRARREPSMIFGLARSAGVIDWMIASIRSISRSSKLSSCSRNCPIPGSIPMILDMEPILRTCCICSRKSSRVNSPPAASFSATLRACSCVEGLLGLLDQGEHVTHVEDARGHPIGVEDVEVVELLTVGREHDRRPVTPRDRERGTTAGVAVELGEHDAVEADALLEGLRGGDRVLADHRVDDEEDLVGVDGVADVGCLLHQLGVDAEAAGGVDDDDVVLLAARPRRSRRGRP